MKTALKNILISAVGAGLFLAPALAGALVGEPSGPGAGPFGSISGVTNFVNTTVIGLFKWAFWALAVIMVIYAAFVYLTAGG